MVVVPGMSRGLFHLLTMLLSVLFILILRANATSKEIKDAVRKAIVQNMELPGPPNNYMDPMSQNAADYVVKSDTHPSKDRNKIEAVFLDETTVNRNKVVEDVPVQFIGYVLRFDRIEGSTKPETIVDYLSRIQTISEINAAVGFPMGSLKPKSYRIASVGIGAIGLSHTKTTTTGETQEVEITKWICLTITLGCQKVTTSQVDKSSSNRRVEPYVAPSPVKVSLTNSDELKWLNLPNAQHTTKYRDVTSLPSSTYPKAINSRESVTSEPKPSIHKHTVFDTDDTSMGQFSEFEIDALNAHNELREKHGAPPLILSRKLCNVAQGWIKAHATGTNNGEIHNPNSGCGENIYTTTLRNIKGNDPVDSWYLEKYNYYPNKRGVYGHFTQLIWKGIGNEKWKPQQEIPVKQYFGVAIGDVDGSRKVVANYYPAGNVIGHYDANVSDTIPRTEFVTDKDLKRKRKEWFDRLCEMRR